MSHPRHLRIEDFTYELPERQIARYPLPIRDASRLLVYHGAHMHETTYRQLPAELPAGSLMVFNQTRVVHARLLFQKATGGQIEIFCLEPHTCYTSVPEAMGQQGHVLWQCLVGGAAKWKHGMTLSLQHEASGLELNASIAERTSGAFVIAFDWTPERLSFSEVMELAGRVPLPPYLKREAEAQDETTYQTVFAREAGSVAAPTAGLHFTERVLHDLQQRHINTAFVTLHVGAGTFKPVKSPTMEEHDMHAEWIELEESLVQRLLDQQEKGPVIAVGTTSLRSIESLYWLGRKLVLGREVDLAGIAVEQWDPYETDGPDVSVTEALQAVLSLMRSRGPGRLVTRTRILIAPGYQFRIARGLVTNFHQPQSTLLLLVAALIGPYWRNVYNYALAHDFRFLSYGDGCLLWAAAAPGNV
jgi:S-adenosylmethionine:tRNA ribosyltransferase-isomerase